MSMIDTMIDAARSVRSGDGTVTTSLCLAGRQIHVATRRHVNAAGIALERAFLDCDATSGAPMVLTVIDDVDAGYPPPFDWPPEWNEPWGLVREDRTLPCRFAMDIHTRSFSGWDPLRGEAVVWFRELERIPYWAAATPFRLPLSWMADSFDAEMIHGAAVMVDDQAVLLIGPSGAGKSTLALAALKAGLSILGDDFLLLCDEGVQSVYRRAKAHDGTVAALGSIPGARLLDASEPGSKRIFELDPTCMSSRVIPVCAVLAPSFGARPGVAPLTPAQAARRLVMPSMEGLLGGTTNTLGRVTRLLRHTPTAELILGPDPSANVRVMVDAARSLASARRSASPETPVPAGAL